VFAAPFFRRGTLFSRFVVDSNHRSPVKDQLVETVLFDFPAEARKRTIGGRRYQQRDLQRAEDNPQA
jgi:hypothetical protein